MNKGLMLIIIGSSLSLLGAILTMVNTDTNYRIKVRCLNGLEYYVNEDDNVLSPKLDNKGNITICGETSVK
jgi:hypothetical protein